MSDNILNKKHKLIGVAILASVSILGLVYTYYKWNKYNDKRDDGGIAGESEDLSVDDDGVISDEGRDGDSVGAEVSVLMETFGEEGDVQSDEVLVDGEVDIQSREKEENVLASVEDDNQENTSDAKEVDVPVENVKSEINPTNEETLVAEDSEPALIVHESPLEETLVDAVSEPVSVLPDSSKKLSLVEEPVVVDAQVQVDRDASSLIEKSAGKTKVSDDPFDALDDALDDLIRGVSDWENIPNSPGLYIWRIEDETAKEWPVSQYGNFYNGDSYIILNSYTHKEQLKHDLHMWLGKNTTMEEAVLATSKITELDILLGEESVQHREVEGHESSLFLSYFKDMGGLVTVDGGTQFGSHQLITSEEEVYPPILLQCKGRNEKIQVKQVPLSIESLNSGDVFILDLGDKLYQFNGKTSGIFEKKKGSELISRIREQRASNTLLVDTWVVDEISPSTHDTDFWNYFGGKQPIEEGVPDSDSQVDINYKLFKLSDERGNLEFELVEEGRPLNRKSLKSEDVFLIDTQYEISIWIGKWASKQEKGSAMSFAKNYIKEHHGDLPLPVTLYQESGVTRDQYDRILGRD